MGRGWHAWSSDRFLTLWKLFLSRPDAPKDAQFQMIRAMYDKVSGLAHRKA